MIPTDCPDTQIDTNRDIHIKTGDYFSVIATTLGFVLESLREIKDPTPLERHEMAILPALMRDLRDMDKRYEIREKPTS